MPEKAYPALEYECDCGGGVMRPTGQELLISPSRYVHARSDCGYGETFTTLYPRIEHRRADEEDEVPTAGRG